MEQNKDAIFYNLQKIRLNKSLTQAEVAAYMGYELSSSVSHVEAGRKGISGQSLIDWLYALDIDLLQLTNLIANEQIDLNLIYQAINNDIDINSLLKKELEQVD